jgi:hypothetical protein
MNVLHRAIDDVLGDNVVELYRRATPSALAWRRLVIMG